ncbi:DUF3572 domain-containing protein, partial [Brucella melitensis]
MANYSVTSGLLAVTTRHGTKRRERKYMKKLMS